MHLSRTLDTVVKQRKTKERQVTWLGKKKKYQQKNLVKFSAGQASSSEMRHLAA